MKSKLVFKSFFAFTLTMVAIYGINSKVRANKLTTEDVVQTQDETTISHRYYVKYLKGGEEKASQYMTEHGIEILDHMQNRRVLLVVSDVQVMAELSGESFVDYVEESPQREPYSQ
ncbi:hypothetical protein L4C33_19685 [Vibrio makurazakiensis]|uniref:hypothetical protein n=1 Tax=Vibrio makurazakiensis TaxID=2910250 RepID=UPI003D149463